MSNRKINYNRKVPSSESVKERQNFEEIMSQVTVTPTPFFKSIGFWGAIGSSVIALTLLTYQFLNLNKKKDAYEATPTLAVNSADLPQDTPCLTPINKKKDYPFETTQVDPMRENSIYVEGGAIITIPANSFDNLTGEKITIKTRVFRDKSEAFMAGVPMDYGDQSAFESAGMIEIRGEQNGRELKLKDDKEISIELGLHKSPEDFNFYALDESDGEWTVHDASYNSFASNEEEIELLKVKIEETNEEVLVLDREIAEFVRPTKSDFNLVENQQRVFELKFNKHEFPELKSFERLQFEAKCSSIQYREILHKTWSNVELKQNGHGNYIAEFSNRSGDKREIKVIPVVSGKQAEIAFEEYQQQVERIEKERREKSEERELLEQKNENRRRRLNQLVREQDKREAARNVGTENRVEEFKEKRAMLSEFYNASAIFTTNRWGLFNCDKPVRYPQAPDQPYTFAANSVSVNPSSVHVFDLNKDVRYQFGTIDHPIQDVAVNNNETVLVVTDAQGNMAYAKLDGKQKDDGKVLIELTPIDAKEADLDFFKTLLDEKERVRA